MILTMTITGFIVSAVLLTIAVLAERRGARGAVIMAIAAGFVITFALPSIVHHGYIQAMEGVE